MASLVCGLWGFPDGSVGKEPRFDSWVGKIPRRRDRLHTPVFLGFPGGSAGKESACNAGDLGLIPGWEDPLKREQLPSPGFWPGEFHGLYSLGGCKESDTWQTDCPQKKEGKKKKVGPGE